MKKTLALLLALCMVLPCFAMAETVESTYTYNDSVSTMATNWNQHTYQTTDDAYPISFLTSGLYEFLFNDELHPKDGMEPYAGYVIVPEMAAELPVDVTAEVRAAYPQFNIPESAEKGYAYKIALNPNAKWSDGTPINAETYVESMKRLLDPKLLNYRATDYVAASNQFVIAGGEAYYNSLNETVMKTAEALGYSTNEEAFAAGIVPMVPMWDFYGLKGAKDANGNECPEWVPFNDEVKYQDPADGAWVSAKDIYDTYGPSYLQVGKDYACQAEVKNADFGAPWENVGVLATDEYELTLVLGKSLTGFYLLYSLSGNWIVKTDLYDDCLTESNGVWTSTYCTSLETSVSYGPYMMTSYQTDKQMVFEKNPNWHGWTDGKHVYVDPVDGETYDMYQTTKIVCDVVPEAPTRKQMFLNGQLIGYGLQADDMDAYRTSEYAYVTPGTTIYFMILNGYIDVINQREAAADFDTATQDLQTITLSNFRKAMALVYDRDALCATLMPSRGAGFGIIGTGYIADPESGLQYRDTDAAKKALCDFYSIDVSKYDSLDDAVDAITGYDPVKAKELFGLAFKDALEAGYITDADNDGICDQTITMEYSISTATDFQTKTVNYLTEKVQEVIAGTPFEGKIFFKESAPYGNDWSTNIRNGTADTVLGGWNGSAMDPFGVITQYTNPSQAYDGQWFDATKVDLTLNIQGVDLTMTLYDWAECLNGAMKTVDGVDYNFGADQATFEDRLTILGALETTILGTYNYIPMIQDGSMSLLSQKVFYVVEEYNPVMGRGGIAYMKYNYDDAEWDTYVAECGGTLTY